MRKFTVAVLAAFIVFCLTACFETESVTSVNRDGSGSMQATVDFSSMMALLSSKEKEANKEEVLVDTIIHFLSFTDTASSLTARQKQLLEGMQLKIVLNSKKGDCIFTIWSPFKNISDLNELNRLMTEKEFDDLFDRAVDITPFGSEDESAPSGNNDNLFGSVFPDFFDCVYTGNSITCAVNKEKYDETLADMKKSSMDLDDKMTAEMLEAATFTNRINLPGKPVSVEGAELKQGETEQQLVQKGNVYDLYKNPQKYAYSIRY